MNTVGWIALGIYLVVALAFFLFLHGFSGGVFGDPPLWKELAFSIGWPLLVVYLIGASLF